MMNYIKQNHLAVLIVLFLVFSFIRGSGNTFGAPAGSDLTTSANPYSFTNTRTGVSIASTTVTTFRVGTGGTPITNFLKGTCTLGTLGAASIDASHAASTTKSYDCPVTGVTSGDTVIAMLATSTPSSAAGGDNSWAIVGAKASTTAGYISVNLWNGGGTRVPSATQVGSSTAYIIIR